MTANVFKVFSKSKKAPKELNYFDHKTLTCLDMSQLNKCLPVLKVKNF